MDLNHSKVKNLPGSALLVGVADVAIITIVSYIVGLVRFSGQVKFNESYLPLAIVGVAGYLLVAIFSGVYQSWRGLSLADVFSRFNFAYAVTASVILAWLVFTKTSSDFSRIWLGSSLISIYLVAACFRIAYFYIIKNLRRKNYNVEPAFVAYTSDSDIKKFDDDSFINSGYRIAMRYQLSPEDNAYSFLLQAVKSSGCNELWLFVPIENSGLIRDIMYALRFEPINIRLMPDFGDQFLLNAKPRLIGENMVLDLSCTPLDGKNAALKRFFDIIISASAVLFLLPIMLIISLLIKFTSAGPITFKQERNGLYGQKFWVYKFRSMAVHNEVGSGVTQARKDDARITKVGALLRQTSLDELPQFMNVLRGDMSIVGPRPHALAHNEYYSGVVESYMWRNKIKPGITGWAQVNGHRGETDTIDKMAKRIEYDLWYMENWSLWLDVKIFIKTFTAVLNNKNAY